MHMVRDLLGGQTNSAKETNWSYEQYGEFLGYSTVTVYPRTMVGPTMRSRVRIQLSGISIFSGETILKYEDMKVPDSKLQRKYYFYDTICTDTICTRVILCFD